MRLACWRARPRDRGLSFCCLNAQRMRNLAKRSLRRDACATQTSSPRDDTEPPSLPYRLRDIVFHWTARGISCDFELGKVAPKECSGAVGRWPNRRIDHVRLGVSDDAADTWISRGSEFHLVHVR